MKIDTKIYCDLCHAEFNLTQSLLREESVELQLKELVTSVSITLLQCPHCGKVYPVSVDTSQSAETLAKVKSLYMKRVKYLSKNKPVPTRLEERYQNASKKLNVQRQKIAETVNGAIYQLDGDTLQLDYRYRTR